jgi:hypothetical protein
MVWGLFCWLVGGPMLAVEPKHGFQGLSIATLNGVKAD